MGISRCSINEDKQPKFVKTTNPLKKSTKMNPVMNSAILLASTAMASYDDIIKHVLTVIEEDTQVKSINVPQIADGYGCYCMFTDISGAGRSDPVDGVDSLCKQINDAYTCIATEHPDCNPATVAYNKISFNSNDVWNDCMMANRPTDNPLCSMKVCAAEFEFAANLAKMTTDVIKEQGFPAIMAAGGPWGFLISDENKHANFDFETQCPKSTSTTYGEKKCCGSYPSKFPYRDQNGARQCCTDAVFNSATHQCCNGDEVKLADASC